MNANANNRVNGGRNPNLQSTCRWPLCAHLIQHTDARFDGGWCGLAENRVQPTHGWQNWFTPSVSSLGGCDKHTPAPPTAGATT